MIQQGILVFDDDATGSETIGALKVAGRSLRDRALRTLARAGIERLLVVLPRNQAIDQVWWTKELGIDVQATHWGGPIPSLYPMDDRFLLLKGEYVHHHSSLSSLMETRQLNPDTAIVAQVSESSQAVGTTFCWTDGPAGELASSGAFACRSSAFELDELLTKTVDLWSFLKDRYLQKKGATELASGALWQPVSDRQTAREAKRKLFDQVSKSTTGFIARLLNVRISVPISKVLIDTGISPNLVTLFMVLLPGLAATYIVTTPEYRYFVIAGLVWQLASILDGCDGEIARVKLAETRLGAWFDTVTDNLAYLSGAIGLLIAMCRLYPESNLPLYAGISGIGAITFTLALMYFYAIKTGTGSLQFYLSDLTNKLSDGDKDWSIRFINRFGFITKRDFLSAAVAVFLVAGQIEVLFWCLVLMVHIVALGVLTTQYQLLGKTTVSTSTQPTSLLSTQSAPATQEESS